MGSAGRDPVARDVHAAVGHCRFSRIKVQRSLEDLGAARKLASCPAYRSARARSPCGRCQRSAFGLGDVAGGRSACLVQQPLDRVFLR